MIPNDCTESEQKPHEAAQTGVYFPQPGEGNEPQNDMERLKGNVAEHGNRHTMPTGYVEHCHGESLRKAADTFDKPLGEPVGNDNPTFNLPTQDETDQIKSESN